jgi:hypothetical protein
MCGSSERTFYKTVSVSATSQVTLAVDRVREYFENNFGLILIWIVLFFGAEISRVVIPGWLGFGVAVILGIGAFFIRDHARIKGREIMRVQ